MNMSLRNTNSQVSMRVHTTCHYGRQDDVEDDDDYDENRLRFACGFERMSSTYQLVNLPLPQARARDQVAGEGGLVQCVRSINLLVNKAATVHIDDAEWRGH